MKEGKFWIKDGKVAELSDNEKAALPIEQLAAYTTDSANYKMSAMEKSIEEKAGTEEFEGLKKQFETMTNSHMKSQDEILLAQGKEISKLRKEIKGTESGPTDSRSVIAKSWDENKGLIEKMSNGEQGKFALELKTEVARASVSGNTMAHDMGGVGKKPVRSLFMEDLFMSGAVGPNSNGVIRFWDQTTLTRNAAAVAESGTIPESAITWTERTQKIEKIGDSIPVTMEALADVDFINSELNNFLLENVALKLDNDLLLGDGSTPNLAGIDSIATAYSVGAFVDKIDDANIFDVVSTAMTQLANNGLNSFYSATAILMHPTDVQLARLTKDANGNYVMPMWLSADGNSIEGVRVISNPLVTQNTCYVGDFNKGTVWSDGGVNLSIAQQHGTDWLDDVIRMKATVRKSLVVRNIHQDAFIKVSNIAQAILDLETP